MRTIELRRSFQKVALQQVFCYVFNSSLRHIYWAKPCFHNNAVHRCPRKRPLQLFSVSGQKRGSAARADRMPNATLPGVKQNPHLFPPILDFAQTRMHGLAGDCCLSNKIYQAFEMRRAAKSILAWPEPGHRCVMRKHAEKCRTARKDFLAEQPRPDA
jgi:hypothetical protein